MWQHQLFKEVNLCRLIFILFNMKKLVFGLFAALMVMMSSCGGSKEVQKILTTIPRDTKAAIVVDFAKINEKLDKEGSGSLQELIISAFGNEMDAEARYFLGDESPIDFNSSAVFFEFNEEGVYTFYVKDPKVFRDALVEKCDMSLIEKDGVWCDEDNKIFQLDNQVWVAISRYTLSASDVKDLASLSDSKSIMDLEAAKKMVDRNGDISFLGNLNAIGSSNREFAQMMMGLNMSFDDPAYVEADINFEEGKVVGSATILNSKGKIAKCAVSPSKIDMGELKSFSGRGNAFLAFNVNASMMDQALSKVRNMGIPEMVTDILGSLDGEIVISGDIATIGSSVPSIDAMVTFDNASNASKYASMANAILPEGISLRADGRKMFLSIGNASGAGIESVADKFNGSAGGFAILLDQIPDPKVSVVSEFISAASIISKPAGDGVEMELNIDTKPGQNSLVTILKFAGMAKNF